MSHLDSLLHVRRQMPVGQGGFHVGVIAGTRRWPGQRPSNGRSLYVYDCGAVVKKHVLREIEMLRNAFPEGRIDVLALSHFDTDHIRGTPHLLDPVGGFTVDTIMLPYVDMDERIVALARAAARHDEIDDFLMAMVGNPVDALADFRPRRIIFVRPSAGDGDDDPLDSMPDVDPFDGFRGEGAEAIEWILQRARQDRPARRRREANAGTEVLVVQDAALHTSIPGVGVIWKLRPYVKNADPRRIADFRNEIEKRFKWASGSFKDRVANAGLRQMMVTTGRAETSQAYKEAFGDKNLTSLCLYSGPEDHAGLAVLSHDGRHGLNKIGWLGTGDAHLRKRSDVAAIRKEYGEDIDQVLTYVFPHHGSIAIQIQATSSATRMHGSPQPSPSTSGNIPIGS